MTECYNRGNASYQKWFIGNQLRALLMKDDEVKEAVGTKIFPIVAPENTVGDFIVYSRQAYSKQSAKQGVYEDRAVVALAAISDSYDKAVALASKIDNALTGRHILEDGTKVYVELTDSTEEYQDEKYIETIIFAIK